MPYDISGSHMYIDDSRNPRPLTNEENKAAFDDVSICEQIAVCVG